MTLRLVNWAMSNSTTTSRYSMLKAVLLWNDENNRGIAVWDMSYGDGSISSTYRDFYSRWYQAYADRVWHVVTLKEL